MPINHQKHSETDSVFIPEARREAVCRLFREQFGGEPQMLVSAPGRTEIAGNHTDHNGGLALAGAVDLDILAAVSPCPGDTVQFFSEGFGEVSLALSENRPDPREYGTSAALIRGIAALLRARGFSAGGFRAAASSLIPGGAGLSSSAAFEVLVCTIFSHLYNGGGLCAVLAAQVSMEAEIHFFGKPCGLLDQLACSEGGCIAVDLLNQAAPHIRKVPFSPEISGFRLCIVDTRASHAGLTKEYAAVADEMRAVARMLGAARLRDCSEDQLLEQSGNIRKHCGDRALLRAVHFFRENRRVEQQARALEENDFSRFLTLVRESGRSSFEYLQNVLIPGSARQELAVGLCFSERLHGPQGASRVHGGGFAGTLQSYVPLSCIEAYRRGMEDLFGAGCCHFVSIRESGGTRVV